MMIDDLIHDLIHESAGSSSVTRRDAMAPYVRSPLHHRPAKFKYIHAASATEIAQPLAGIHEPLRVERPLDPPHEIEFDG